VPEPPPGRDPTRADAASAPYEPPPDLLRGEVYRAATQEEPATDHHHHGGHAPAKPTPEGGEG
jgi:hypothetical protein